MYHQSLVFFTSLLLVISCTQDQISDDSRSGFININDVEHYYSIIGKGDTLVILHGGPGLSHRYMLPQLDSLLSSRFTLLFYDQRGSGWTGGINDTTSLNIESFVQDLEQIREHFGIKKINLLGHSMVVY